MKNSFSPSVRDEICRTKPKNKCCRKAMLCGMLFGLNSDNGASIPTDRENVALCLSKLSHEFCPKYSPKNPFEISKEELNNLMLGLSFSDIEKIPKESFVCLNCGWGFIRGLFLVCGTVASPSSGYHLEFLFKQSENAEEVCRLFESYGYTPGITERRGAYGVYFKDSENIADILGYMNAPSSEFDMLNAKILKDVRNDVNRSVNCETANMNRTSAASSAQIKAIEKIVTDEDVLASLSEDLKTTLDLRIGNPDATLAELSLLHNPPVTKSCVTHRLQRLMNISKKL